MRALVISGGGCKGAYAGGIAEYLIHVEKIKYELFVGSSTGSLLIPLLSLAKTEKLKNIFTSVTQKDIFSSCPFIIRKRKDEYRTSINHLGILKMFMKGKKTFGETFSLRKLICSIVNEDDFNQMKSASSDVVVSVSNLSTGQVEFKSLNENSYHDYCDWIWASASAIPFMSLVEKNGCEYADGGLGSLIPIAEAIRRGACEIDVIVLKSEKADDNKKPVRNALELTTRTFDFMLNQIAKDDIDLGVLHGVNKNVKLNFYYPPKTLTNNSLIFDPVQMSAWWKDGYLFAENKNCCS